MEDRFCCGIRYREAGRGRPVLLIHGLGGSLEAWEKVMSVLSRKYRTVAIDLPGHGLSRDVSGPAELLPRRLASDVEKFISGTGLERPAIVTHSFGCLLQPWLEGGERILVSPPHEIPPLSIQRIAMLGLLPLAMLPRGRRNPDRWDFSRQYPDFDFLEMLRDPFYRKLREVAFGFLQRIEYRKIPERSVVVHGRFDRIVPPRFGRIVSMKTGSDFRLIDTNHLAPVNAWKELSAEIMQFLGARSPQQR